MSIVRDNYPRCCGFKVLREFPMESGLGMWLNEEQRKIITEEARNRVILYFKNWRPQKMNFILVINENQEKVVGDLIVSQGKFRLVDKTVNPNTHRTLFTYIRSDNLPLA